MDSNCTPFYDPFNTQMEPVKGTDSCCRSPLEAQSWIDWTKAAPTNPLAFIENAILGSTVGSYVNSTNYGNATFVASTVVLKSGQTPLCAALETDNLQMVADADM